MGIIINRDFRYFYKGIFPIGNFPRVLSQVAILPKCAISQAATFLACPSRSARPSVCSRSDARPHHPSQPQCSALIAAFGASEGLTYNLWEVAAWEISYLGSYHLKNLYLGSRPWENAFRNTFCKQLIATERKLTYVFSDFTFF